MTRTMGKWPSQIVLPSVCRSHGPSPSLLDAELSTCPVTLPCALPGIWGGGAVLHSCPVRSAARFSTYRPHFCYCSSSLHCVLRGFVGYAPRTLRCLYLVVQLRSPCSPLRKSGIVYNRRISILDLSDCRSTINSVIARSTP